MKITDEMLYRHAPEARDVWLASLPDDSEIPEHQFSEAFNSEMERLVALSQKQKKSKKKFQRIAAMFAAVLIGASSFVTINSAARVAFVGWIKELTSDYLVYRFEEDPVSDAKPMLYCPTWIPDGYEQFHFKNSNGSVALIYKNDSGEMIKLRYIYNPDKTDWFISTENTTKQSTTVNGNKAELFVSTDPDTAGGVVWTDENNCAFMLSGFLDVDDLIKMAESIQPADPDDLETVSVDPIEDVHYGITAIPEGYVEVLTEYDHNGGSLLYENESGQYLTFLYMLNSGSSSMYVDTTNTNHYQTVFDGYTVDVMISDDPDFPSDITWVDNENTVFVVSGYFDADALFAIAESIEHVVVEEIKPSLGELRYEPTFIPDGYIRHRETDTGNVRMVVFKNDAGQLLRYTYVYEPYSTNSFVIAEGSTHSVIEVNGYQADMLLFEDLSSASCIMWTDENDCVHSVHAFLEEDDLIKLAESVKIIG